MKTERGLFNEWLKHYEKHDVVIDQLQRAFMWQAWQSSAQREGYKLVPVETTAKQNREGVKKFVRHRNENTWSCDAIDDIYKAMIGAADEIN